VARRLPQPVPDGYDSKVVGSAVAKRVFKAQRKRAERTEAIVVRLRDQTVAQAWAEARRELAALEQAADDAALKTAVPHTVAAAFERLHEQCERAATALGDVMRVFYAGQDVASAPQAVASYRRHVGDAWEAFQLPSLDHGAPKVHSGARKRTSSKRSPRTKAAVRLPERIMVDASRRVVDSLRKTFAGLYPWEPRPAPSEPVAEPSKSTRRARKPKPPNAKRRRQWATREGLAAARQDARDGRAMGAFAQAVGLAAYDRGGAGGADDDGDDDDEHEHEHEYEYEDAHLGANAPPLKADDSAVQLSRVLHAQLPPMLSAFARMDVVRSGRSPSAGGLPFAESPVPVRVTAGPSCRAVDLVDLPVRC